SFGSDSFLDVTTNMVGVLIIFILLVGLRAAKVPPPGLLAATKAALDQRLDASRAEVDQLRLARNTLAHQLDIARDSLSAKSTAVEELASRTQQVARSLLQVTEQIDNENSELLAQDQELDQARSRLVSLGNEVKELKAGMGTPQQLVYRSPLSRPIEAEEIHFELRDGLVAFIDLTGLMERAKGKWKAMEDELRSRGRASGEVGPIGAFRLRFTMVREEMPFTQSLLYGNGSFRARLAEWEAVPVALE